MIKIRNVKHNMDSRIPLVMFEGSVGYSGAVVVRVSYLGTNTEWPVSSGHFKALVHLEREENEVYFFADKMTGKGLKVTVKGTFRSDPRREHKQVRVVYLLCKNDLGNCFEEATFQSPPEEENSLISAVQRIRLAVLMIQLFFAETLPKNKTFSLELDSLAEPRVHVLMLDKSNEELSRLCQSQLWEYVGQELLVSSIADPDSKYLAFCSFTRYVGQNSAASAPHSELVAMTRSYVALGGGGLALLSTQCLYTWPSTLSEVPNRFADSRLVDKTKFMDDSANRRTFSGCYSTTLGSCVHELGHTFDLGHSTSGIMSRGFDDISVFFTLPACDSQAKTNRQVRWWDPSSEAILCQHKWLNQRELGSGDGRKEADSRPPFTLINNTLLKSLHGIVVIEYREPTTSLILQYSKFTLPAKIVKLIRIRNSSVFAIDIHGNAMKIKRD